MRLPIVKYEKILYATDLSDAAQCAFAHAVSLAARYGASITVLHVIAEKSALDDQVAARIGYAAWNDFKNRAEVEARESMMAAERDSTVTKEELRKFCERARICSQDFDTANMEIFVERGDPCEQILKCAHANNNDLIVIGHHTHSRLIELLVGSKAGTLMMQTTIPVLVVGLSEGE